MNRKTRIAVLLWILALAVALWCVPARAQTSNVLPLKYATGRYYVSVVIEGQSRTLLLDTGANYTIVAPGIVAETKTTVSGKQTSGNVLVTRGQLSEFKLGSERIVFAPFIADMKSVSQGAGIRVDGILGMDALTAFHFAIIDFRKHTLTLER